MDIRVHKKTALESICLITLEIDLTEVNLKLVTNRFARICDLMQHKHVHTEDKPHRCDACGKSFSRKSNLTIHNFIHTQETPVRWETCEQSFNRKGDLGKHILFHSEGILIVFSKAKVELK